MAGHNISPLEYARINMLSRDHKADRSGLLELENLCVQARQDEDVISDSHLPAFDFGSEIEVERLQISKEATMLIQSVMRVNNSEPKIDFSNDFSISEMERVAKNFRLELPLLYSDHETDCRNFGCRDDFEIKIQDVKLPLEVIDEVEVQSYSLNSELWNLGPKLLEKLRLEKLCVSKNTLSYLQEIFRKDLWTEDDAKSLWNSQQIFKRSCSRSIVTPPLSPIESPPQLYQPSSSESLYQIALFSDPVSPTKREIQELESGIFRQDVPTSTCSSDFQSGNTSSKLTFHDNNNVKMRCIYSPLKYLEDPNCYPLVEVPRVKRESLKMDEVLTPTDSIVVYSDPTDLSSAVEKLNNDVKGSHCSPDLQSKLFEDTFLPAYESTIQKVEQEQLMEADATCRVTISNMDFSKEEPPWGIFEKAAKDPFNLLTLQKEFMKECFGSSPVSRISPVKNDHKLRWSPFSPNLTTKITEEENLKVDDSTWEHFIQIENATSIIESSNCIWKAPGLRIAREDDESDDEVESCPSLREIPQSFTTLARKRKMRIEEQKAEILNHGEHFKTAIQISGNRSQFMNLDDKNRCEGSNGSRYLSGGAFSACNALENFLEIRGAKKLKLTRNAYYDRSQSQLQKPHGIDSKKLCPSQLLPQPQRAPVPVSLILEDKPRTVIIKSTLFARRVLIKTVEKLLPRLNFVERDFSIHNTIGWMHGSVARSPVTSPLSYEADIIISPITGIILTTLQKVRQKPLPGQKTQSSIRTLLISISLRYENIIVLVSEDRADECTIGLNARDCVALSEFIGFTCSLDLFVIVKFVSGGEESLAQRLVGFIVRYNVEDLTPVQDETLWELFLRRAGFNAFAAQAVIANMKTPISPNETADQNQSYFGLMGFVGMSAGHRMHRFGSLIGKNVMERVSKMIDSTWNI